jgi:hypothetical protein
MKALTLLLIAPLAVWPHPMGNFSVNHYTRMEPGARGLIVTYVLDLAELPTTELIQSWGVDRDSPRSVMEAQANAQVRQWAANLKVAEEGKPILGVVESSQLYMEAGAANLPIYRISARIRFLAKGGRIEYEDGNYITRAGWREIVARAGSGAELRSSSANSEERSQALTSYPKDQEKAPPQDSKAWLEWRPVTKPVVTATDVPLPVTIRPVVTPAPVLANPDINASRATGSAAVILVLIGVLFGLRYRVRTGQTAPSRSRL